MYQLLFFFPTTEQKACTPGWLNLGDSCFRIYSYNYQTSKDAMFKCHNLGGRRAVLGNAVQLHSLSRFIDDYIGDPWLNSSDRLWPCHWNLSCGFVCETDERKSFVPRFFFNEVCFRSVDHKANFGKLELQLEFWKFSKTIL